MSIRRVTLPGTDLQTSAIGFGCASLGSRIATSDGLRSLEAGYEAGVTWYDVAPPYGAGEAEIVLGEFLKTRRDRVQVCTKVGLTHPERNQLMKLVYATARPVAGKLKALRRGFRALPSTRYRKVPLDAPTMRASLDRSLARLGTDHVDVFALHDPDVSDVTRDEVLRALEEMQRSGKARYISVAGNLPACLAGIALPSPFGIAQFADAPGSNARWQVVEAAGRPVATVTHSVFGVDGSHERLRQRLISDPAARGRLATAGYDGSPEATASALLMDRALAANQEGVVLASMFSAAHRNHNIERASRPVPQAAVDLLRSLSEYPALEAASA
ncbi:hypothetical protein FHS85_001099 [Rhodoligotrophos appendicifer]|uniref:aldo/keto reductase n=1 Tax=Rhodoligotrophos appendicifer TaxID=987056 RepID=UPI0011849006|nr:aldo/keto reductase [Rhodoligotrophos appendicifer]